MNKGTDKQCMAVFYTIQLITIRIISQVVAEKSLTEKITNRQTNTYNYRKGKTIYPLYTSYHGYNKW